MIKNAVGHRENLSCSSLISRLGLTIAIIVLFAFCYGQSAAHDAPNPNNALSELTAGSGPDYTRLIFSFTRPLGSYVVHREDADSLAIDFGKADISDLPTILQTPLIKNIVLTHEEGRLLARIELNAFRYEVRHFLNADKYSCIIDFKEPHDRLIKAIPANSPAMCGQLQSLSLVEEARRISRQMRPPRQTLSRPEELFRHLLDNLAENHNEAAWQEADNFLKHFHNHRFNEPVKFLLPEILYAERPGRAAEAASALQKALVEYPDSLMAPRASFMLGKIKETSGQFHEAAAQYKLTALGYPESLYASEALLKAADLLLKMGRLEETRQLLKAALLDEPPERLTLEIQARLGMADFYEGLYSQASETFREILKACPQFYINYPEMLYALGEGYHYLNRPDISRPFLLQALSLMPDHPKAGVMMARIGDNYRLKKRYAEAIAVYGVASRRFHDGDGGMISQARLAGMGSLHSFFPQNQMVDSGKREFLEKYPETAKAAEELRREHSGEPSEADLISEKTQNDPIMGQTENARAKSPQAAASCLDQAHTEMESGRLDEAIATLEKGVAEQPSLESNPEAQALLLSLYLDGGRVEDWAELTERNLNRPPGPPADLASRFLQYNHLAQVYQELGRLVDAERNYDATVANRPPDLSPEALYAVARAYKKLGCNEKYGQTLSLIDNFGDPFWKKIIEEELASLPDKS